MTNPRHQPTPTEAMLKASSVEQMAILLEQGADINAVNKKGATPLFDAVRKGRSELVRYLLAKGARVDLVDGKLMPLCMAAARNHIPEIIDDLVAAGMDPFLPDAGGNIGVMVAKTPRVLQKLVDIGLDVNAANHEGQTTLHYMMGDHFFVLPQTFPILIKAGANPNAQDHLGRTPLMLARQPGYIQALLDAGADASLLDLEQKNALHHLMGSRYRLTSQSVEMLVVAGADPLQPDTSGETPVELLASPRAEQLFGAVEEVRRALVAAQREILHKNTPTTDTTPGMRPRF